MACRNGGATAASRHLSDGAAKVHVQMVDAILVDQLPHRFADVVRIDAVELQAAWAFVRVELREPHRLLVRSTSARAVIISDT